MPTTSAEPATPQAARGTRGLIIVAAATLAAALLGGTLLARGGDTPPLELSLGGGDGLASCLPFDVAILADMSPAFAGTVTAIDGERVSMDVDRWYTGGDAARVDLVSSAGAISLIGGVDFAVGGRYLVTATGGIVNACGYSGAATPEYEAAFEQAFGQ